MDLNDIETEEIRPLTFNYLFHFILFALIFILHLILFYKIYWISDSFGKLFLFGTYFGIIYFIFPIIPIFLILFRNFKLKRIIIFRKLTLLFLLLTIIIGLIISTVVLINTLNSKLFCKECPFNLSSISHLNSIFQSYYGGSSRQDIVKDKCKSRRCTLDSVKIDDEYPYIYLCNYDPSSDINEDNEVYKRILPDGTEISVDYELICSPLGISYSGIYYENSELYDYLNLCYSTTEFYYCKRFNKPQKVYDLDLKSTCPETSYLFLLYIICVLIIIIDLIISLLPWGVEYVSLKRIIQIMSTTRRKANSNNSTAKSSVVSNAEESFKKERTLFLFSPNNIYENIVINIYNNNNNNNDNNNINNNNIINNNKGIKESTNQLIDNNNEKIKNQENIIPFIALENSERVEMKKNLVIDTDNNNPNILSINVYNKHQNPNENIINTDTPNIPNKDHLSLRDRIEAKDKNN